MQGNESLIDMYIVSTYVFVYIHSVFIYLGMESYEQCGPGRSYCSLCTLDTIHKFLFVTRLIINQINKVQWVDFKLENQTI
jgi:hypothetical protein